MMLDIGSTLPPRFGRVEVGAVPTGVPEPGLGETVVDGAAAEDGAAARLVSAEVVELAVMRIVAGNGAPLSVTHC
jgi:hypothetical protein